MIKLVESNHYHIWTDALHARALAHEAINKWDRGTYVRWTAMTAWIALEIACQDALEDISISYRFQENLNRAIKNKSLPNLDWSRGIWQKVTEIQELRKNYVHRFNSEVELFPDASMADKVISTIREAITTIYEHVGEPVPTWIKDDFDQGWANKGGLEMRGYSTPRGLDEHAPDTLKITYLYKDREHTWKLLYPGDDYNSEVDNLIADIDCPISAVKVYKGKELIFEKSLTYTIDKIRGIQ